MRAAGCLQDRLRPPSALRPAPVYAFEQHRQLRLRQRHSAVGSLRPDEAAALKALGQQAQAVAAPPQHLDHVAAPATEHEHVAAEGIFGQRHLYLRGQTVHASAHLGDAGGQPNPGACWQSDHGSRRANNSVSVATSTWPSSRNWAWPTLSTMTPDGPLARVAGAGGVSTTVTANNWLGALTSSPASVPKRLRQLNSWLVLIFNSRSATPMRLGPRCAPRRRA